MGLGSFLGSIAGPVLGGLIGGKNSKDAGDANYEAQKEFAQYGIRWKVDDARAAGIHPLYALGAQTLSFAPSYVGDSSLGAGISAGLQAAGSEFDRAREAKQTDAERLTNRLLETQIQGQEIENAYRASRLARLTDPTQVPPAMPSVDGGALGDPSLLAGLPKPSTQAFELPDGSLVRWPSPDAKQAIEDSPYEYEHMYHTRFIPWLDRAFAPITERLVDNAWWWRYAKDRTGY